MMHFEVEVFGDGKWHAIRNGWHDDAPVARMDVVAADKEWAIRSCDWVTGKRNRAGCRQIQVADDGTRSIYAGRDGSLPENV